MVVFSCFAAGHFLFMGYAVLLEVITAKC